MTALQATAILFGGGVGALLRFVVSSGVYQWLGRDFPYGTLTVNVLGSFLIGLLSEGLLVEPVGRLAAAYRPALLVGFLGAFTTFSTFSLETLGLLEQGQLLRALTNVLVSVLLCLAAVALGVYLGRLLLLIPVFLHQDQLIPYGQVILNLLGSFLIGFLFEVVSTHLNLSMEWRAATLVGCLGLFTLASGLYLVLHWLEGRPETTTPWTIPLLLFLFNTLVCTLGAWLGSTAWRQL